jgi:hypothetical protein
MTCASTTRRRDKHGAALRALEAAAREAGYASLPLHTFGHVERARRLYEAAGYRTTRLNMRKDFG